MRSDCPADTVPDWLSALHAASVGNDSTLVGLTSVAPADVAARRASILIAFCTTPDGPGVLLTERARGLRSHPGQVAFPGGAAEPDDADASATAIREANEEVGLDPNSVRVLGHLPERFLRGSNFLVTPVLAWWAEPHPVEAVDTGEVARATVVSVADLVDPANRFYVPGPGLNPVLMPGFEIDGLFIWGFTAILLAHLLTLGGWDRPWDQTRLRPRPVPAAPPANEPPDLTELSDELTS